LIPKDPKNVDKFKKIMNMPLDIRDRKDGYNVKRLREILGIKQDDLADRLDMSQQAVSKIEQKDMLEEEILDKLAKAMGIPIEAIKNFSEDSTSNFINTFYDNSSFQYQCTFNPLDKVIELYERMLKAEQDKVAILEKLLNDKK